MKNQKVNNDKSKQKKKIKQSILLTGCFFMIGLFCGILVVSFLERMETETTRVSDTIFQFVIMIIEMYIALYLQIVLHEAGHLLFGRLSGYRFGSFRIGSLMLIKENKKTKIKKLSIAGTGGQCLMCPPDWNEENFPYILYNLGGIIMNLIVAILYILIYLPLRNHMYLGVFLLMMAIIGVAYALINGIPMRLGMVDNDGYNAKSLGKDVNALHAFWLQMKINECVGKGMRLREMPEEWFEVPEEAGLKNSMTVCLAVFACNRLMDEHKFEEAEALIQQLLEEKTAIIDLHRKLLICDQIYCELIGERRTEMIEGLYDKEFQNFMKLMKKFPSVLRTQYTYALLLERDDKKAEKLYATFDKVAIKYPYPCDILSERELIQLAKEK